MSDSTICNICVEKFNKSSRKPISCNSCDHVACTSCCQNYLLTVNIPQCMSCHREWLRKFLNNNFTKVFLDKILKEHHKKYLFDIETSLLPNAVIESKKRRDIQSLKTDIKNIKEQIYALYSQIREKEEQINEIRHGRRLNNNNETTETNRINFIRRCPVDNCKGYLSTRWKCELCSVNVCKDCHKIKLEAGEGEEEPNHVCNADDVETARMISNNTKACPSCTVPIFKIDGCDQMWCVSCHTAFSWTTGRIQNTVHNPHYFEWLRRNNNGNIARNPLDIQCGRELDNRFIMDYDNILRKIVNQEHNNTRRQMHIVPIRFTEENQKYAYLLSLFNMIRNINHILHIEIPRYSNENVETYNLDLRIRYINNEINEVQFKRLLSSAEKRREKNREIHNILTMYCHSAIDIIHRVYDNMYKYVNNKKNNQLDLNIANEIYELIKYVNENLSDTCKLYSMKNELYITSYDGKLSVRAE